MTANEMTTTAEFTDLLAREKTASADPVGRDEEITRKAMLFEDRCDSFTRADAAVIHGDEYVGGGFSDGSDVPAEEIGIEFVDVGVGAGEAA